VSPHRDAHLELCAGYALGALSESDRKELEAHLEEGCPICTAELDRLSRGAWLLAASSRPLRAPATLRRRVLEAVQEEPRAELPPRPAPIPLPSRPAIPMAWVWAAAAAVIAVAGVLQWRAATYLETQLARTREEMARLEQEIQNERSWAAVSSAPDARVVQLEPTPNGSPDLAARVTYDPTTRRALVAVSNFTPPSGKDYQLWAILKSGPLSLGLVRPDSTGRAVLRLSDVADPEALSAFAVSLENEGGAPTPHAPAGPVVMLGKVGG
jgi:anti-sigma-K factor RskA